MSTQDAGSGPIHRSRAAISFILLLVYLLTNVVGLHAAEANMWAERRASVQKMKGRNTTGGASSPDNNLLLAQLPKVAQVNPFSAVDFFTATNRETPHYDLNSPGGPNVPSWLPSLVLPYGTIRDVHIAKNPAAPLVVHVQDAHEIEEAQKNTASMIEGYSARAGVALVGLEGAAGAFQFEPYRAYPDKDVTKQIAGFFLKEGYIGGTEFAAMTLPQAPLVWGVEDLDDYLANIAAYQDAVKHKPAVDPWLHGLEAQAEALKEKIYSDDLKALDKHSRDYREQRAGLGDYVAALFSFASPEVKLSHPQLQQLLKALTAEKSLDFHRVEKERVQLVESLVRRLSKSDLEVLVQKSLAYRTGRLGYGDFHQSLKNLCRTHGVSLSSYTQFNAYVKYVVLADRIDRNILLSELDNIEEIVPAALAKSVEQKTLVTAVQYLAVLKKLINHQMTPADWTYYADHKAAIAILGETMAVLSHRAPPPDRSFSLAPFEDFCRLALQRNRALVGNLLDKMKKDNARTAFLVAGGFHTGGMTELLRQNGASYVVVTPKITEIPKENHSLDVFAREPMPLEKLFSGERISLASWRLTASGTETIASAAPRVGVLERFFASLEILAQTLKDKSQAEAVTQISRAFGTIGENDLRVLRHDTQRDGVVVLVMETQGRRFQLTAIPEGDKAAQRPVKRELSHDSLAQLDLTVDGNIYVVRLDAVAGFAAGFQGKVRSMRIGLKRRWDLLRAVSKPSAAQFSSALTIGFTHRAGVWLGLTKRQTELWIAPWLELPLTLLPFFVFMHDNRDPATGETSWAVVGKRLLGHLIILTLTAIPFFLLGTDASLAEQMLLAVLGNTGWHFTHQVLFPEAPLKVGKTVGRFVPPGERRMGDGYTLNVPLSPQDEKYQVDPESRHRDIDYYHESNGLIDAASGEMPLAYKEVRRVVDLLLDAAGLDPGKFLFHFQESEELNAIVIHSNHIVVNTELLRYLLDRGGTLDTLAFVLAHEITHIVQNREDVDQDKVNIPKNWKESHVDNYINEYDADWRALKLLDKVHEKSGGKEGFALERAPFLFKEFIKDMETRPESTDLLSFYSELSMKFGTHPQLQERVRRLENLIHHFYWRSTFRTPTPFSLDFERDVQTGSHRSRFRRDVESVSSLPAFDELLSRVTSIEELEYLIVNVYERCGQGKGPFDFNVAFQSADQKMDEWISQRTDLFPYYLFIFSSLGRFTGMNGLDYDRQKQIIQNQLRGLEMDQLRDLLKIQLPPVLETEEGTPYYEYKYWFYGMKEKKGDRGSGVRESFVEIWMDSLMEAIEGKIADQGASPEVILSLESDLEVHRQRIDYVRPTREMTRISGLNPENESLFQMYHVDLTWALWQNIERDTVQYEKHIPELIKRLQTMNFGSDKLFRQGAQMAVGGPRHGKYVEMIEGVRRLAEGGKLSEGYLDLVFASWNVFSKEYFDDVLKAYPQGTMVQFPGDLLGDFKVFLTLFPGVRGMEKGVDSESGGANTELFELYGDKMVEILERLIGQYGLTDTQKFEFLEEALQRIDQEVFKRSPKTKGSLFFLSKLDQFVRGIILQAKPGPELTSFLTERMAQLERKMEIKGLTSVNVEMQKLIFLYAVGSGEPPWTLNHVLLGRDTDNSSHIFESYTSLEAPGKFLDPFLFEYTNSSYSENDAFRSYDTPGLPRIADHPLYGVEFSNDDLVALYRVLASLPEKNGPRSHQRIEEFDPRKNPSARISSVETWEEYVAAIGIESFLRAQRMDTTNSGLRPRVFDPGEYERVPSYYKAFSGELFEVPGLEGIGFLNGRSPLQMAEKHRNYHKLPVHPQVLLRQYFNDGPVDQMFEKGFGFVRNLSGTYEEKLDYLVRGLPPSVFRNYALYALFLNDVLQRPAFDMKRSMEPGYLQSFFTAHFNASEQRLFMEKAQETLRHVVWDRKLEAANQEGMLEMTVNVIRKKTILVHDQRLAEENQKDRLNNKKAARGQMHYVYVSPGFDSTGLTDYQSHVPGGIEAHIEFLIPHMFVPALEAVFQDGGLSLKKKMDHLKALYPRASPIRDQYLDRLLETAALKPKEIQGLLPLFSNEALVHKHSLGALEKEKEGAPDKFKDFDHELDRIVFYFPDYGYTRDDLLNHLIQTRATIPRQLQRAQRLLLQFQDNVRQAEVRGKFFGHDFVKTLFQDYAFGAEDKKLFLLWVMGFTDKKPDMLILLESLYQINFDGMRSADIHDSPHYKEIGRSAFEDTLVMFLFGEEGILSDPTTSKEFLNEVFDSVIPAGIDGERVDILKNMYLAVFDQASEMRKEKILKQLFLNIKKLSQEEGLSPEIREAKAIRGFLESLGPVGIKLGQFLESARLDIPAHVTAELAKLKEEAPELNKGAAFGALELEFGDFYRTFRSLDQPLGSASIKMVYKAKMKDGRQEVVKLKRPYVEGILSEELGLLSAVLEAVEGPLARRGIHLPADMVAQVRGMMMDEVDFDQEVKNQRTLKENIDRRRTPQKPAWILSFISSFVEPTTFGVHVPDTLYQGNNVIMEELVEGVSLGNESGMTALGLDPSAVKEAAAEELLKEIFIDGFFHADPHGGNIFVDGSKRLTFIDLGLMGTLPVVHRRILLKLILYAYKDKIGLLPRSLRPALGVPTAEEVAVSLGGLSQGQRMALTPELLQEAVSSSNTSAGKILNLLRLVEEAGGSLPEELTVLSKALGTAGHLFEHLTLAGIARVMMEVLPAMETMAEETTSPGNPEAQTTAPLDDFTSQPQEGAAEKKTETSLAKRIENDVRDLVASLRRWVTRLMRDFKADAKKDVPFKNHFEDAAYQADILARIQGSMAARPARSVLKDYTEYEFRLSEIANMATAQSVRVAQARERVNSALGATDSSARMEALGDLHAEGKSLIEDLSKNGLDLRQDVNLPAGASRAQFHAADLKLVLLLLLGDLLEKAAPSDTIVERFSLMAQEGVEKYNGVMGARYSLEEGQGAADTTLERIRHTHTDTQTGHGVIVEASIGMLRGAERLTGQEQTGYLQVVRAVLLLGQLDKQDRAGFHVIDREGTLNPGDPDQALRDLVTQAARATGQDARVLLTLLEQNRGKVDVRIVRGTEKINPEMILSAWKTVTRLDVFALDAANWDVSDSLLQDGIVRLLVMLAGDRVSNATGTLSEELHHLNLVNLQA